jgi:hypothetical protein
VIKQASTVGRVIISGPEGVIVVDSAELQNYLDAYIARFVDQDIRTDPDATHRRDVWEDYADH